MDAPERAAPFEPFSARSQHLGWLDLTFVKFDRGHALEDVDKDIESAFRVKAIDCALERREWSALDANQLADAPETLATGHRD